MSLIQWIYCSPLIPPVYQFLDAYEAMIIVIDPKQSKSNQSKIAIKLQNFRRYQTHKKISFKTFMSLWLWESKMPQNDCMSEYLIKQITHF